MRACLEAGKPVLCEKPLAATAEASLRVLEAEAQGGRRLVSVGFMRRHDPGYVALKDALGRGEVGDPLMVHCAHRNAAVPAFFTSEMLITSSAIHEIDVARWLLGEEIVSATVHTPRSTSHAPAGLRDPQFVVLESEGGVLIDVEVYVNAVRGYEIRCEVVGESGSLLLEERPLDAGLPRALRGRLPARASGLGGRGRRGRAVRPDRVGRLRGERGGGRLPGVARARGIRGGAPAGATGAVRPDPGAGRLGCAECPGTA